MRGRALSFIIAGITVGLILGAPIGTWVGNAISWRYLFALVSFVSFITTIGVFIILPKMELEAYISLKKRLKSFNKTIYLP